MENRILELEEDGGFFSTKKHKWQWYWFLYTAFFLLSVLLAYSPFIQYDATLIHIGDGRLQHFPTLIYLGRSIRQVLLGILRGEFTVPLFDISLGLGDDVIGFLNTNGYTNPLMMLAAVTPTKYSEQLYTVEIILHLYLAGICFTYMCCRFGKQLDYVLIGSLIYSLCGYGIGMGVVHPIFLSFMISLPLLIVGADKVLRKEAPYGLAFAVFFTALCGYYSLYIQTVMVGVYLLVHFFDVYRVKRIKEFVLMVLRIGGGYLLGLGLCAAVFLPSVAYFLNSGRRGFSVPLQEIHALPNEIYGKLTHIISPPGGQEYLTVPAIALFALILLFASQKRRSLKIMVIAAFATLLTASGGMLMNGFQYPSSRWTYGFAMLLAFIVVEMLPELQNMNVRQRMLCLGVALIYILSIFFVMYIRKMPYVLVGGTFLALFLVVLTMSFPAGNGIQTWKWLKNLRVETVRNALCLILVVFSIGVNGIYTFSPDQGNAIKVYAKNGTELDLLNKAKVREFQPYLQQNPSGRADSTKFSLGTTYAWYIPGMIEYNSAMQSASMNLWNAIEHIDASTFEFCTLLTGGPLLTGTILSQKYQLEPIGNESFVPYGYVPVEKTEKGDVIYENEYALPWGYTYEKAISYDDLSSLNGLERQEAMLQAVALDRVSENDFASIDFVERELPYQTICRGCTWEDGQLNVAAANATLTLEFSMPGDTEAYLRFDGYDTLEKEFGIYVSCSGVGRTCTVASSSYRVNHYFHGRDQYLVDLGYDAEPRNTLIITFPVIGSFRLDNLQLYSLPIGYYTKWASALGKEAMSDASLTANRLTGTVDASGDRLLCVSLPYSKGWTAKVDGEKVEIQRGNYFFMVVPLEKGHHEIEFTYCSPGLKIGIVLMAMSWIAVAVMLVRDNKKKKRSTDSRLTSQK